MPPNRIGPIVRIAELEIDPNQIGAYNALLSEEVEASVRIEPGVLFLYAVSIKGSPHKVRVIEAYADHANYEAHLTTPHFLKYKTHTAGMVRSLRLLETEPINLKAKKNGFKLTHYPPRRNACAGRLVSEQWAERQEGVQPLRPRSAPEGMRSSPSPASQTLSPRHPLSQSEIGHPRRKLGKAALVVLRLGSDEACPEPETPPELAGKV